jgi:hypothetical protein
MKQAQYNKLLKRKYRLIRKMDDISVELRDKGFNPLSIIMLSNFCVYDSKKFTRTSSDPIYRYLWYIEELRKPKFGTKHV